LVCETNNSQEEANEAQGQNIMVDGNSTEKPVSTS
jgi:hypothetical protein